MALPDQNITLAVAADYLLQFTCKSTNLVSAYPLQFTIRLQSQADPILTKTVGSGITVTGSSGNWTISVVITKTDTTGVTAGVSYLHSLWREDLGNEYPLATGEVVFKITSHN